MRTRKTIMQRQCKRCDRIFLAKAKTSRICKNCKIVISRETRKGYYFHRTTIDRRKLLALKKKLDKMSYAEAIR